MAPISNPNYWNQWLIQVEISQILNFGLEKRVLQLERFPSPARSRIWRNVPKCIPKDAELCTLRVP